MSTALAVAAVTAALRQQFGELYNDPNVNASIGTSVNVSALAPSKITLSDSDVPRLNIFMYQVSPNAGGANVGFPIRNGAGVRVSAPPLSIDLYYMLTAYGQQDFEAEAILGYAMQMLYEQPGLDRRRLRDMTTGASDSQVRRLLASSRIAEQVELIKFSMQQMSGEEISKLWTAFQSQYQPSAAYHVSVVLIDSETPTRSPLPVREPRLHVHPLRRPRIESITPQIAQPGDTILLRGDSFIADTVQLVFGGAAPQAINPASDQEINITLPAGLKAGVNTVQVLHSVNVSAGGAEDLRRGVDSNVGAFVLAPQITTSPIPNVAPGATLSLDVAPPVEGTQRVELLIGERALLVSPRLSVSSEPLTETTLNFHIPEGFTSGTYITRLRIDGAESPLQLDGDNRYVGPELTIT